MKRYAWIETKGKLQIIKDICIGNPYDIFPSDVAKFYSEEIPDEVVNGAIFNTLTNRWENPPVEKPSILDAPIIKTSDLKEYISKLNIETSREDLQEILSLISNDRVNTIKNEDGYIKQIFMMLNEKENI